MKCPVCNNEKIGEANNKAYRYCPVCRAFIIAKLEDDPELKLYKYKPELFRCRALDVEKAFAKARAKFENNKFEVVAVTPSRTTNHSIILGYGFICMKRKRKTR